MRRFFALLAVAAALVSGCSGPSASPATTTKGPGPAVAAGAANPCAIFPLALANQILAAKGDKPMAATSSSPSSPTGKWLKSSCTFTNISGLSIEATTYLDADTGGNPGWQEIRKVTEAFYKGAGQTSDLSGLGDQAYSLTLGKDQLVGVFARQGRLIVFVGQVGEVPVLTLDEAKQLADAMLHNYQ